MEDESEATAHPARSVQLMQSFLTDKQYEIRFDGGLSRNPLCRWH